MQALAERFPKTPVYPGLNTQFMGILESQGVWTEKCAGCGNCRLGEFAGICPITRCAKRLLNGPCGGSQDGKCEVNPQLACGWQLIYDRACTLGILDRFAEIVPPHDWSTGLDGGPRQVVREDQCIAGLGPQSLRAIWQRREDIFAAEFVRIRMFGRGSEVLRMPRPGVPHPWVRSAIRGVRCVGYRVLGTGYSRRPSHPCVTARWVPSTGY